MESRQRVGSTASRQNLGLDPVANGGRALEQGEGSDFGFRGRFATADPARDPAETLLEKERALRANLLLQAQLEQEHGEEACDEHH